MAAELVCGTTERTKQVNIDTAFTTVSDFVNRYWRSPGIIPYGHPFYRQGRWPDSHSIHWSITRQ